MTRKDAITTGSAAALRFGKAFIVYRFPAWPPDVYGCIGADRDLPTEAETFERLEPFASGILVLPVRSAPSSKKAKPAPDTQGSLFT